MKWSWTWSEPCCLASAPPPQLDASSAPKPEHAWPLQTRILLLSDSHGRLSNFESLLPTLPTDCQTLWHMGDICESAPTHWPLTYVGVQGNCDLGSALPLERLVQLGPWRILLTHGHRYGVKSGMGRLLERLSSPTCQAHMAIYGHTHISQVETVHRGGQSLILLNPGSWMQGEASLLYVDSQGALYQQIGYYQRRCYADA